MAQAATQTDPIRVIHLSSAHFADDSRIFWKECISLAKAGYDVSFVVADDRFATDGGPVQREGVDIVAVKRRKWRLSRMLRTTVDVIVASLRRNGHIYHFHDPELIPAGLMLRALGKHVIYDVHEDLPRDILTKTWIPKSLRRPVSVAAGAAEWIAGQAFSGVVAATPVIAERFPKQRAALVQNFAHLSEFAVIEGAPLNERNGVAFVGCLTADRCAFEVVEAVARVKSAPEATLIIAGPPSPSTLIDDLAALPGWPRVDFRGHVDRAGVQRVLSQSRVGLVVYHPHPNFVTSQPVKLFEYMAAGLPIIAADFPAFRKVVEDNGCGLCVPPQDPDAIAEAIDWIFGHPAEAEEMGRRGRSMILDTLNWNHEERELIRLYDRITGTQR